MGPTAALELTLAMIKPSVANSQTDLRDILGIIKRAGFEIVRTKRLFWTRDDAGRFYAPHQNRFFFQRLVMHATSAPFMALALAKPNAIADWRALMGPTKVYRGQFTHPDSLRALYGTSDTRNGFHGSDSVESAKEELALVFEGWDTAWWLSHRQQDPSLS